MTIDCKPYLKQKMKQVDTALSNYLKAVDPHPKVLYESMGYSIFAGGKRLRPILTLATCEAFNTDSEAAIPTACAIEMIHTYSLIHDDLPAMDNDDFRRGKLTNHRAYNEAIAILAGDALLTKAFHLITMTPKTIPATTVLQLIEEISVAAGAEGMVGGQMADMEAEGKGKDISLQELNYIHSHKTGALFTISVRAGAIIAGVTGEALEYVTEFASKVGLAFQIQDDILDIIGDEKTIGKTVGSDIMNDKSTYPSLVGLEESKEQVKKLTEEALMALEKSGCPTPEYLIGIANYLIGREK